MKVTQNGFVYLKLKNKHDIEVHKMKKMKYYFIFYFLHIDNYLIYI